MKKNDFLTDNEATLEQLDTIKQYGYEGLSFDEALGKIGIDENISGLEYAHDMGEIERLDKEYEEEQKELNPPLSQEDKEHNTKQFTDFRYSGAVNLLTQNKPHPIEDCSSQFLAKSIADMVKKMQSGDTEDILTVLTTNLMQVQLFNGRVTANISKDEMSYKNWELLSKMQMRLLQESRKTAMAINEICNPKRTTFVKNATQHNHLNSEKNNLNQNELSQPKEEIINAHQYTEAETVTKGTDN